MRRSVLQSRFLYGFGAVLALSLQVAAGVEVRLSGDDVVALVGGEDLVAAAESGRLELALQMQVSHGAPGRGLRVRSLAWEGDTVFEQKRDLNYPTLEQQLEKMHATALLVEFGQMESFAGDAGVPAFQAAYEKLLDRLTAGASRKLLLVAPTACEETPGITSDASARNRAMKPYVEAIRAVANRRSAALIDLYGASISRASEPRLTRDSVHLNEKGQRWLASVAAGLPSEGNPKLLEMIQAKNRFWFYYTRPQNWAFLNGDRTSQPSSRDYLDPSKRWFPTEMEEFVPLIEKLEAEIASAARQP